MLTKTTAIARNIIRSYRSNPGVPFLSFNDRLVNGRRSLKVWGWNENDYDKAKQQLEAVGCQVKKVKLNRFRGKIVMRLHVTE